VPIDRSQKPTLLPVRNSFSVFIGLIYILACPCKECRNATSLLSRRFAFGCLVDLFLSIDLCFRKPYLFSDVAGSQFTRREDGLSFVGERSFQCLEHVPRPF
jgi:hypothetical protein